MQNYDTIKSLSSRGVSLDETLMLCRVGLIGKCRSVTYNILSIVFGQEI